MALRLNKPQGKFLSVQNKFNAFVGGYRSGKTFVGCIRLWTLALRHPDIRLGYFAPTYPMIQDIFYTTISDVADLLTEEWGINLSVDINMQRKEVSLLVEGKAYAVVKCRSMEHAHRIVGFDISHAQIDEIDTMKMDKATAAWRKIVARMSSKRADYPVNTVDFTTTPEGFNFVYDLFVRKLKDDPEKRQFYSLTRCSTLENAKNLPDDYIPSLYATYPANLVDSYVKGEFVNLTSGAVYPMYDREANDTLAEITDREPLHIGMDFNVNAMSAIIHVIRDGNPCAVDEIVGVRDTPAMIEVINERYREHKITIYPDSAGKARKSVDASKSDISLLEDAGFYVDAPSTNPFIKDRVSAMNAMLCNAKNERKYKINQRKCPQYCEALEQQVYDKGGMPEKGIFDNQGIDAGGYFINRVYPIIRPATNFAISWG